MTSWEEEPVGGSPVHGYLAEVFNETARADVTRTQVAG